MVFLKFQVAISSFSFFLRSLSIFHVICPSVSFLLLCCLLFLMSPSEGDVIICRSWLSTGLYIRGFYGLDMVKNHIFISELMEEKPFLH